MINVYIAGTKLLDTEQKFEDGLYKVNEQRRAKVLRCKNEDDKKRTLLAGLALRYGLEQMGLSYDALEFAQTPEGKPYLVSYPQVHFSLSHSGEYAVCVISDQNVGVDVENQSRRLLASDRSEKRDAVARQCFTEEEYIRFSSAKDEEKNKIFVELWTKKEAVSKAVGKGLAMDFTKICEPEENFWSLSIDDCHYASVYCEDGPIRKEDVSVCMMN